MGAIHCPMGAAFYDDEPCIDCGLCSATSKEQMIAASKKVREHLRSHAERSIFSKKIGVAGKGGVGKSTVVALMAMALRDAGREVLVLDTDESNPGLHRLLGLSTPPLHTLLSIKDEPEGNWLKSKNIRLKDVPPELILENNGIKLLTLGKIIDPFQGCACSMADEARQFLQKVVPENKEIILVDIEAGVESFGRGVERGLDTVLIVVEPSLESVLLAETVCYMAEGIGINRIRAILNKILSEDIERKLVFELSKRRVQTIGTIPLDPAISEAGLSGEPLSKASRAISAALKMTKNILEAKE